MANKPQNKRFKRPGLLLAALLLTGLALLFCHMRAAAFTVHVAHTDVYLKDLPSSFEGATVLYVTDIDLISDSAAKDTATLFERLQALQPDILLLGGDYTDIGLFDALNSSQAKASNQKQYAERRSFFQSLAGFYAPMGKYAVAAADDGPADILQQHLALGGVELLYDKAVAINKGGECIYLAGLSPVSENGGGITGISGGVTSSECVVAAAHSAAALSTIQISEAKGGGPWADVALFGKSHGGQIRIGNRTLTELSSREKRYLSGWHIENGIKLLVSHGLGCEGVRLRLGSRSEVHFLTLRRETQPDT